VALADAYICSKWHLDPCSVAWVEAYLRTKWHLDLSDHLATTNMGQKLGEAVPLWGRSWVPT